jgi:Asp/Glu/hydantoin racemase
MLPLGKRVGIVTINAESLESDHLRSAGVPTDTPIEGVAADAEFRQRILNDDPHMDFARARTEVVDTARRLVSKHANIGAIISECTNMPPYRQAMIEATGLPVYDALTLANWLWAGVSRNR